MAVVKMYDQDKKEAGEITLAPEVFEVEVRPEILNLVVRAYRAALRAGTHAVKTRALVSGGGKKPFKQKGTGNARQGSNRSPIMRGGAIIFGPQPRDYSFKVNRKVRSLALRMALSSRLVDNDLMVVKSIALPEAKTKHFAKVAGTLGLSKALVVASPEDGAEGGALALSARNIPGIKLVTPDAVNVYEVLNHKQIVVLEGALPHLEARLK
ncbi:MAG TPA: 50S ribosomal protein L4 [Candidatus Mailhella merdigallinarum]|uniref:Large ribosomal subunit protein uL4 n=1 Tax=Candidatus Mailhella merdigallinarum TaxID=2838658 RepID=A0A9D2KKC0_9BACT|nr:MAG: 50S ribosomal protein L4 [Desulfovibrionaceae bacterium]HJA07980.1 50S ribosomal protein L4 [Candidatus Mailhella merdigallinarum]